MPLRYRAAERASPTACKRDTFPGVDRTAIYSSAEVLNRIGFLFSDVPSFGASLPACLIYLPIFRFKHRNTSNRVRVYAFQRQF